jgi:hypothetical protein
MIETASAAARTASNHHLDNGQDEPLVVIVPEQRMNVDTGPFGDHWYRCVMDDASPVLTFEELAEAVRNAPAPTADDVSITWDGRRLDSREKVVAFLAELDAARSSGVMVGPPLS